MTLSRRLTLSTGLIIAALLAVAVAGLWGVSSLNRDLTASLAQYERMRRCYEVGVHAWRARQSLSAQYPRIENALGELVAGMSALVDSPDDPVFVRWHAILSALAEDLSTGAGSTDEILTAKQALNALISGTASEAAAARREVIAIQASADRRRQAMTIGLAGIAGIAGAGAVLIGLLQYRVVMRPVRRLGAGVASVAAGRFDDRLAETGPAELAELARDFNRMAGQLETLYNDLESQVRAKSAALARSERLASVGHLAAGVAHEINNPLGIIAAHAELALRDAQRRGEQAQALTTIRDEAFRCKAITDRLLSLSRGSVSRATIDLLPLAQDVARQVEALPVAAGKRISITGSPTQAFCDPALVRQVVLNLMVNALEACAAPEAEGPKGSATKDAAAGRAPAAVGGGAVEPCVVVAVASRDDQACVVVSDTGVGMTSEALTRVFEPFYTTPRRGGHRPGTGLGLSISHAITEQLGGTLAAASEGEGKGSVFTLTLPRAAE